MAEAYTDLQIRIYPYDEKDQAYPVEAELGDGSRYTGGQLKLDRQALLAQQLNAEAYGMALFNALFAGDIRRAYDKATGAAEAESGGRLRVRLWVDDEAVELHAIPWERIYHLHKGNAVPLGASTLTPFSRYTSLEAREPAPIPDTPIRMLVAVANPSNLPNGLAPANVDVEVDNLRRSLSELKKQGKVEVTIMPGHTGLSSTVRAKLEAEGYTVLDGVTNLFNIAPHLAKCHIFHFIGHGAFRRKSERGEGTAALYLEKADGAWQAVRDEEIVSMFTALGTLPHLVFLVACESATREAEAETPFVGLGPKLVQAGVPAVVAMQAQVPVELARLLSGEFYSQLAQHGEVDRALNQARLQVFDGKRTEWGIPVLFMRIRKGRLFGEDLDEDAPTPGEPPYKGLEYFGEKDADKFYGREALTAKLVGKLRLSRFLPVIIGASGSGKSSVIRAGLLPALSRGSQLLDGTFPPEGSTTWMTFTLTPGVKPLDALAAALTRDEESATATTTLIDDLAVDKRTLHLRVLKLLSRRPEAQRALIVVDQFEEIFTLTKDEGERKAFIDALLYASTEVADGPTIVIIIFRADFYAYCAQYANLREAVATRQEFVGPMNRDELRRAIEEPARVNGWDFEPGLVDLILKEVGDEPGALPLMQHALLETWKRRRARTMTLRGYNDAGGIRGAIAKTAEAIYQALPPESQTIARRIFLKLVELGEGTQDTRRRAQLAELYPQRDERGPVEVVLKKLVDNRLVVTTDKTAEVAHEALIREWPTYREWVNTNRAALKTHRELTRAANEWDAELRSPQLLYWGIKLLEAKEWADANPGEMNSVEEEFLTASREEADREAKEQELQRQRELEQAKRIAEEQSRAAEAALKAAESEKKRAEEQAVATQRQRFLTRIAGVVGVLAVLAAIVAGVFWFQANASYEQAALSAQEARNAQATAVANEQLAITKQQEADAERVKAEAAQQEAIKQAELAENRALIAAAYNNLDADPQASLILAQEAVTRASEPDGRREAKEALYKAYGTSRLLGVLNLNATGTALKFQPYDEQNGWLAMGTENGELVIFDTADLGQEPVAIPGPEDAELTALTFSPDGRAVMAGYDDGTASLWDVQTGEELLSVDTEGLVSGVAFDPNARWFITADFFGVALQWDANSGELIQELAPQVEGMVYNLIALSADGTLLAVGDGNVGLVDIYRLRSGEFVSSRAAYTLVLDEEITALAFAANNHLATATTDSLVTLWDMPAYLAAREAGQANADTPITTQDFVGHSGDINAIAFSTDGKWMVTAGLDWQAKVWEVDSGRNLYTLSGHTGGVFAAAFLGQATSGLRVATTSFDGTLRLWWGDLGGGVTNLDLKSPVEYIQYGPNGQLALGTKAGDVWLRDAQGGRVLGRHEFGVTGLAFNAAGDRLISTGEDGRAIVWNLATGQPILTVTQTDDDTASIRALAYSADGQWLATAGSNGTVHIWDANTGARINTLNLGEFPPLVFGLAFSPSGAEIAVATFFGDVLVFERATGTERYNLRGHSGSVNAVAFSQDGKLLASADEDGQIVIWEMATGNKLKQFGAHAGQIFGLEFTATQLASLGSDRVVKFWDSATWQEALVVADAVSVGKDLTIDASGQLLAVGGADGVARFYPLDEATLAEGINASIHRQLTAAECARFRVSGNICAQP